MLGVALLLLPPAAALAPHALPLHRVGPVTATSVWLLALALRAGLAVGAAVFASLYFPETALFHALAHWCLHAVLPLLTTHLSVPHSLAEVTRLLPALAVGASVLWVALGLGRAAWSLRRLLRRRGRGSGPFGTTVVAEDGVLVAVAGLGRGRILVSDAALVALDGEELAASLAHERGHLSRGHRGILVAARVLATLACVLPGTRAAHRELVFSLERDADEYAMRQRHDPLALASAICKAAAGGVTSPSAAALEGRGGVGVRLDHLVSGGRPPAARRLDRAAKALVPAMAVALLGWAVMVPSLAAAAPGAGAIAHTAPACPG